MKELTVHTLDVSIPDKERLRECVRLCICSIVDVLLHSPLDELGLVFAGACTINSSRDGEDETAHQQIVLKQDVQCASAELLTHLVQFDCDLTSDPPSGHCDIIETINYAAHVLRQRKRNGGASCTICLYTDAHQNSVYINTLDATIKSLRDDHMALKVVVAGFCETGSESELGLWDRFPRSESLVVLRQICSLLGPPSRIYGINEAMEELQAPHCRKYLPRALFKAPLSIGCVQLPVHVHAHTVVDRLPSGQKISSAPDGAGVAVENRNDIQAHSLGHELHDSPKEILEEMRLKRPQSLEAIGFVLQQTIPPFILMGNTKVIFPSPQDERGIRGFSCILKAMRSTKKAMLVRYVQSRNGHVVLGVCTPSRNDSENALFLSDLPFAEDIRHYRFPLYDTLKCTSAEEEAILSLVHDMTVDHTVLRPEETFNPMRQAFNSHIRGHLMQSVINSVMKDSEERTTWTEASSIFPPVQYLLSSVVTRRGELKGVLERAQTSIEACVKVFSHDDRSESTGIGHRGRPEAKSSVMLHNNSVQPTSCDTAESSGGVPAFTVAGAIAGSEPRRDVSLATTSETSTVPAVLEAAGSQQFLCHLPSKMPHITPGATQLHSQFEIEDLVEVIFKLIRSKMTEADHEKCNVYVSSLRQRCVETDAAEYYNRFCVKLMLLARVRGHEAYWKQHVLGVPSRWPLSQQECPSSSLEDDEAVKAFLERERSLPPVSFNKGCEM